MPNRDLKAKTCACGLPGEWQGVEQGDPPGAQAPISAFAKGEGMTLAELARELLVVSACTPDDDRYLAEMQQERQQAAEAIESTTGAPAKPDVVSAIVFAARNRALDRRTTVAYEIEAVVVRRS